MSFSNTNSFQQRIQNFDSLTAIDPESWPPRNHDLAFDWSRPTNQVYAEHHKKFTCTFAQARGRLDYSYHANLILHRQLLQDAILEKVMEARGKSSLHLENKTTERPWIIFTAGAMGVGKGYVLTMLQKQNLLDLTSFIKIDPDMIKSELPEMPGYLRVDRALAATRLHGESTQMADVLFEHAITNGYPMLVDGSLRDVDYYQTLFQRIHANFGRYKIAILHIVAERDMIFERAKQRAQRTGRVVPQELLEASIKQVPESVKMLSKTADVVHVISNNEGEPLKLISSLTKGNAESDPTWDAFASSWNDFRKDKIDSQPHIVNIQNVFEDKASHKIANDIWIQSYPNFCARCSLACDAQCGVCIHGRHLCACSICNPCCNEASSS